MLIAGVDEAGRGALIGDVVAAAVILPADFKLTGLTDSKQIAEKQRYELEEQIKTVALSYAIASASAREVDELNIHHASLLAMKRAVEKLTIRPDEVWVDGRFSPQLTMPCQAFVKGDSLYSEISAASILAKTHRDKQLLALAKAHPEYGFDKHKGYPTKAHIEAIKTHGVLEQHRRSYKTIRELLLNTEQPFKLV